MLSFNEEFWLAISFLIFIILLYKPLKNIVLKSLDQKILLIKHQVLESEKLKEDTERLYTNTISQVQKIELLKEEMLKKDKEETNIIIVKQNNELEKFLENKKLNTMDLINRKNSIALQLIQEELCNKIVQLVSLYLESTNNEGISDIEIAKKFMVDKVIVKSV